jgi:hypothetical protein
MTPTLRGRWQTRLLLLLTVGAGITALFGIAYQNFQMVFAILGYMLGLGLVWDIVYFRFQSRRWDHDWSPVLYLAGAVWEMIFLILMMQFVELPGLPADYGIIPLILQNSAIGLVSFIIMFGPMRIIFPRWRFRGGQWL